MNHDLFKRFKFFEELTRLGKLLGNCAALSQEGFLILRILIAKLASWMPAALQKKLLRALINIRSCRNIPRLEGAVALRLRSVGCLT